MWGIKALTEWEIEKEILFENEKFGSMKLNTFIGL